MSLLRIYKNISVQSGPFNTVNRRVTFREDLAENETIDHSKSYFIANVSITGATEFDGITFTGDPDNLPAHGYTFGNGFPDAGLDKDVIDDRAVYQPLSCQYSASCLVQNSLLDSFTKGNLESNRNINFLSQTMDEYIKDVLSVKNDTWKGSYVTQNSVVPPHFTTHFTDMNWTGGVLSTDKSANVIIPMDDLYMLGNEEMPYMLGNLTYQLELENQDQVVMEYHQYTGASNWYDRPSVLCENVADTTGNENTLTLIVENRIFENDNIVIRWTQEVIGTGVLESFIKYLSSGEFQIIGNQILFDENLFDAGLSLSLISVQAYNGGVLLLDESITAGNAITLPNVTRPDEIPFYVGERIVVSYSCDLAGDGVAARQELYRTITAIEYTPATGGIIITVDGDPLLVEDDDGANYSSFLWTPLLKTQPTYTINEIQLVTWRLNYGNNEAFKQMKNQPILYDKLVVEPFNRPQTTQFQKVYNLPVGTRKHLFLNKMTTLLSNDRNLFSWRQYLDQIPTTDRDVENAQPLHKDKLMRFLGNDLRSLLGVPQNAQDAQSLGFIGVSLIAELNQSGDPAPMLDLRQQCRVASGNINDPSNLLDESMLYLYCWTASQITF
jgi:hypothetical protein